MNADNNELSHVYTMFVPSHSPSRHNSLNSDFNSYKANFNQLQNSNVSLEIFFNHVYKHCSIPKNNHTNMSYVTTVGMDSGLIAGDILIH